MKPISRDNFEQKLVQVSVLAAGYSRRMGTPKGLLPINGEEMLRSIVREVCGVQPVTVILRKNQTKEEKTLIGLPVSVFHLNDYTRSSLMSDSLKKAVRTAQENHAQALCILLGDQPNLDSTVVKRVLERYQLTKKPIVQALYENGPGHPVLFDQSLFQELLKIRGDQGARHLIRHYSKKIDWVSIDQPNPVDIDTPEDYRNYINNKS